MRTSIDLVFEDQDLLIINKPAQFLTIPDRHDPDKPNLYHVLQDLYGQVFVVHRLDFETSGIICFAKNEQAHRHLSQQFSKHSVIKTYRAFITGLPVQPEGDIRLPIGEDPHRRGSMRVDYRFGKPAHSRYRIVEEFRHYSLVEVDIFTGRTHQIRVHLQAIGHPLLVDPLYGKQSAFYVSSIKPKYKTKKFEEEAPLLARTTLHAHSLTLLHPSRECEMSYSVPFPKDLNALHNVLRKYDAAKIDNALR